MKNFLTSICSVCIASITFSQNLVSNWSFESGGCPAQGGFMAGQSPLCG
jgi:hypothetical protein